MHRMAWLFFTAVLLLGLPVFAAGENTSIKKVVISAPTDLYTIGADGRIVYLEKASGPSFNVTADSVRPDISAVCTADEERMLGLINDERAKKGLSPLVLDRTLCDIARRHSEEMAAGGYFGHLSADGKKPLDRVTSAGIKCRLVAENIALGGDVEFVHKCLIDSKDHRVNIMKSNARRVGIGIVASRGQKWFTQIFTD